MFESIKHDDQQNAMRGISSFLISLLVHGAILGVIVVVPLVFCNVLQPGELVIFLLDTPPLPVPPTPPAPPASGSAKPREFTTKGSIDYVPPGIPQEILRNTEEVPDDVGSAPFGWDRGMNEIGIATQEAGDRSVISNYISSLRPKDLPIPKRPKKPEPLPVISSLQESKLIYKVSPVYPDLARITRTSGIVVLEAIIDEEGNVVRLAIVSGHPLLVDAARDAVRQWKYSPTILNGEPMPVIARITVAFQIR
jgi:protein TonB